MNTTRLYNLLTENENAFKKDGNYITYQVYDEILGMVREEIAKEAEKAAGRKPVIRNAVKKFLSKDDIRTFLTKASIQEINGKQYYGYCDGFKLAWSTIDFGYGVNDLGMGLNWKSILEGYGNKNPYTIQINKADVIEYIKTHKTERRKIYTLHGPDGYEIDLNAEYLKACLDFTETTEVIVDLNTTQGPVFFHNDTEDRHALCLPIRR